MRKKIFNSIYVIVIIALFIGGSVLLIRENVLLPDADFVMPATQSPFIATPTPVLSPKATHSPNPTPSPTPYIKPIPMKISFVEQKQSCEVFPGGIDEIGGMEVIDRADAASWLSLSAAPGEAGNAIIAGHKSKNKVAGTFMVLWNIKIGDAVVIDFYDASQKWFYVSSIDRYPFDDVPSSVMDFGGESRLTLITCIGEWDNTAETSSERMVVVCKTAP